MFGRLLFFALETFYLQSSLVGSMREVAFRDSGYITYTLRSAQKTDRDDVFLLFRTIKPSGLLLHAAGGKGDFLTLELLRGKIRYTSNLDSLSSGVAYHEVLVGDYLADNEWHQVEVKRGGMKLMVTVDRKTNSSNISGKYSDLDIEGNIYVAGIDRKMTQRDYGNFKFESFQGCLDDVTFNKINILQLAYEKNSSTTIYGNVTYNCTEESSYSPATFPNPQAYVKVATHESNTSYYNFKFRTYEGDGLLLLQSLHRSNGADISIALESGRIRLDVIFNDPYKQVTLHAGNDLGSGLWHSLSVFVDRRRVRLTVDREISEHHPTVNSFCSAAEVTIGAGRKRGDEKWLGFVGCIYDLVIQGMRVNFSKEQRTQVLLDKCHLIDHCLPSPCKNRGMCIQELNQTKCDCKATYFTGESCEVSAFDNGNCAEWWAAGKRQSRFFPINPGGMKPFWLYCDMRGEGNPKTVVQYEQFRNNITASSGQIIRGFYQHSVRYGNGKTEIEALIESSTHCRQFIQYHCYNSVLFDSPERFDYLGRGARWKSRDGQIQDYWGGASRGSRSCACGEDHSCSQPNRSCNCDIADKKWRSDEGYLTDKTDLPVTSVMFSVDGTSDESYFVLGNLECFGSTKPSTTTATTTSPQGTTVYQSSKGSNSRKSTPPERTPARIVPTSSPSSATSINSGRKVSERETSEFTMTTASMANTNSSDGDAGPIVIIETPRRYITIREAGHQQLVTIVLSIVLVAFICAIIVLLVRQNLLCPCKCLQMPLYEGGTNIELGPSTPLYNQSESEIVQYESSPYPSKIYDDVIVLAAGGSLTRWSPDMDSEAETDRLDISNGSSSDNSEISPAFHTQDAILGIQDTGENISPEELSTAGLTKAMIEVFSLSLSKELDLNEEDILKRGNSIKKPGNKQSDQSCKDKYVPVSDRLKYQYKQRKRMSISDDESIVDTSASDQNNSSDSRLSINTRSWSDEAVGYSENDEDVVCIRSDPTQRQLPPKCDLDKHKTYEGSDVYLSLEREDQFVEISHQFTGRDPWLRNSANHSSYRSKDSVKSDLPARKNATTESKSERQGSDTEHSTCCRENPKEVMGSKLRNGHILNNGTRHDGKAYHANRSAEHDENSSTNRCDEKIALPVNQECVSSRPNELKDRVVFVDIEKEQDREGETFMLDNTVIIHSRHETEL